MTEFSAEVTARSTRLYYDYARAVDEADIGWLTDMAAPDIALTRLGGTSHGLESFLAIYHAQNASITEVCKHVITNITADRQPDGTVQTHAYFSATMFDPEETRIITGHYDDIHAEVDGVLKLAHKKITVERVQTLAVSTARFDAPARV